MRTCQLPARSIVEKECVPVMTFSEPFTGSVDSRSCGPPAAPCKVTEPDMRETTGTDPGSRSARAEPAKSTQSAADTTIDFIVLLSSFPERRYHALRSNGCPVAPFGPRQAL